MPKINVYLPDELADAVREAGIPVSAICQRALEQAVRRVTAIRETAVGDLSGADLAARLPHFTARTRTVLGLAIEQAGAEGAAAVGTGHLLAGVLAERANLALRVLQAVEIDPELVARGLADRPGADEPGGPADDRAGDPQAPGGQAGNPQAPGEQAPLRFSGSAANALELAVTEATAFGHNYVGCEHLLLGLIAEPDGVAGTVLRSLGGELRLVRRAVAAAMAGYVHLRAQAGTGATGAPPAAAAPEGAAPEGAAPEGAAPGALAAQVLAALRGELQPLAERIARIERHIGLPGDD